MSEETTRWRKKPVVVEARRLDGNADDLAAWVNASGGDATPCKDGTELAIVTLEGIRYASPGYWIIKGVVGEFYPCRADVFDATYEAADDSARDALDAQTLHDSPGSDL